MDDNRVVNRLLAGDSTAVERIVNQFDTAVYQYCLQFLGSAPEAEDAASEVFVRLFSQLGSDLAETSLQEWVMRIAVSVCSDWQKKHRSRRAESKTLEQRIQQALQRLVRQQRALVLLRDLNGLDVKTIASILEMDEPTVQQRLARARNNLCEYVVQSEVHGPVRRLHNKQEQKYYELCSRYVDECVTEEEKTELLNHIQQSKTCAEYLENLTRIGRELEHRMDDGMPETLKEDILNAVQLYAERAQQGVRRRRHVPLFTLIAVACVFVLLVCSGTFGGLFARSDDVYRDSILSGSAAPQEEDPVDLSAVTFPEKVTTSSYAFVIAAVGDGRMPELASQAEQIGTNGESTAAFYEVDSDVGAVERLTKTLEGVGYTSGSVYDDRITISGESSNGLLIVINEQKDK